MFYADTPQSYHSIAERRSQHYPYADPQVKKLHEALAPYIDRRKLRQLAAQSADLTAALLCDDPPAEVLHLINLLSALLHPQKRDKIRTPADAAAILMVEMSHLDQEEFRTIMLDTKNQLLGVETVYRGSLNASMIRVGEVYKVALRRNSASIIVAHNHPSGDPTPSPEDVLVTRETECVKRFETTRF